MQTSIGLDDELDVPGERQRDVKDISQVCSMNNWVDIDAFDKKRKYIWRKIICFVWYHCHAIHTSKWRQQYMLVWNLEKS